MLEKIRKLKPNAASFTAVFTAITAVAALAAVWIVWHSLDRTQRAWIATTDVEIIGPAVAGYPVLIRVMLENTGNEPAYNVRFTEPDYDLLPLEKGHRDEHGNYVPFLPPTVRWEENWTCGQKVVKFADLTYFPSPSGRTYFHSMFIFVGGQSGRIVKDGKWVGMNGPPPGVFNHEYTFYVRGCVFYDIDEGLFWRTRKTHFSKYCLYLHPIRGKPFWGGFFNFCLRGNDAN
jgi:hypothetical protein